MPQNPKNLFTTQKYCSFEPCLRHPKHPILSKMAAETKHPHFAQKNAADAKYHLLPKKTLDLKHAYDNDLNTTICPK